MQPSERTQREPMLIATVFQATVPLQISFLLAFNYELTWYSPAERLKVYKTEIMKVLITMIYFNFVTLLFMSWMWQLSK
jgi:hypothetical protein